MNNLVSKFFTKFLTITKGSAEIHQTREIAPLENREIKRPITDSFSCPYCRSRNFVRRGLRLKKWESVQLYICKDCGKTFTPHSVRGKHYPLSTIFNAISLYNLGYSLEESCRKTNSAVNGSATAVRNEIGTATGDHSLSAATLSGWLEQFRDNLITRITRLHLVLPRFARFGHTNNITDKPKTGKPLSENGQPITDNWILPAKADR